MGWVDVEFKIALTPTCIPVGLLGRDLQAISSVALVDLEVRHEPLPGIVSFGWYFPGLPMCIARPLAVNYFSTQQPATLHLGVAGWRAAAFILAAPRPLPLAPLPLLSWPRAIPFHCPEPPERFLNFRQKKQLVQ